ncbi:PAS domain S-box protein [Paenibacillus sp. N3.4]|uniref:PAS domain S-box protein n=1 Tax=Paenibacillus sp. N3.4 TaxID=2603222 RepID=UPI0011C9D6CD|nr:PAS domain S-box protein [Paenibacillus sp. N3.4]TXK85310.1 PAS domain S-box protein [Paenibacillus sp. N3.4]
MMGKSGNSDSNSMFALYAHAPIGVVMVRPDGRIVKANRLFSEFIGHTVEELKDMNVYQITHPEDRYISLEHISKTDESDKGFRLEKRYVHKDGHTIWGLVQGLNRSLVEHKLFLPNYLAFIQDITFLKRQEEELRANKEKYESFVQHASDGIVIYDLEGHVLEINKAFTDLFGWEEGEVKGLKFPITFHDQLELSEDLMRTVTLGGVVHNIAALKKHKDGTPIEISMSVSPIHNVHGEIVLLAATLRDTRVHSALTRQTKQLEESFKQLIENWPDAFIVVKQDRCVYSNQAGLKLMRAEYPEQLIGHSVYEFQYKENYEDIKMMMEQILSGQTLRNIPYKFYRVDGRSIDVEFTAIPSMYEEDPAIHLLLRDITEQIKTEELMRISDKLNAAGQLAAGIAHEIRNPLTAIKGFVQLTQWKYPESRHYFDIIKSEVERIELITGELLLLAKPEMKSAQTKDVCGILDQVSTLLESQGIMNNVQIITDYSGSPLSVMCDANQLKQVFINLLKNAIEVMPKGGEIRIQAEADHEQVKIAIMDQGPGIPPEQLGQIGQPFFTTKSNGTGLGLTVSYKIIQNHGGSINVHNDPSGGAVFTIKLPYVKLS